MTYDVVRGVPYVSEIPFLGRFFVIAIKKESLACASGLY